MNLLAIAYPTLTSGDFEHIQNLRKLYDEPFYEIVKPHFTLVFPVPEISLENFATEIKKQTAEMRSFKFVVRCATINKNAFNENYHTFLVPDEGYSNFVKLHDQLYRGQLSDHLRLDVDFIPHVSIGNFADKNLCKEVADAWNRSNFEIKGTISQLDIVQFENNSVKTLAREFLL